MRGARLLLLLLALVFNTATSSAQAYSANDLRCLTRNVYFEARNQSFQGMLAVAYVTLNRMEDDRFPDSVCKVVNEPHQFSWTVTKRREPMRNDDARLEARAAARAALEAQREDPTRGATHYHKVGARPLWKKICKRTRVIGDHVFYRCHPRD